VLYIENYVLLLRQRTTAILLTVFVVNSFPR